MVILRNTGLNIQKIYILPQSAIRWFIRISEQNNDTALTDGLL